MSGWGMACCPACGEVLVSSLEVPQYEFLCMACGRRWAFLSPVAKPETVELMARHDDLRTRYLAGERPDAPHAPEDDPR